MAKSGPRNGNPPIFVARSPLCKFMRMLAEIGNTKECTVFLISYLKISYLQICRFARPSNSSLGQ